MGSTGARIRLWVVAILGAVLASEAHSGDPMFLWGRAAAGMVVADVRRAVPQARFSPQPERTSAGWSQLLYVRVRTGDIDQRVDFQFKDGRLVGVATSTGALLGLAPLSAEQAATMRGELLQRYGKPIRCRNTPDGFKACFWIRNHKFVGIFERPMEPRSVLLFVHVEQPGDRDLLTE